MSACGMRSDVSNAVPTLIRAAARVAVAKLLLVDPLTPELRHWLHNWRLTTLPRRLSARGIYAPR